MLRITSRNAGLGSRRGATRERAIYAYYGGHYDQDPNKFYMKAVLRYAGEVQAYLKGHPAEPGPTFVLEPLARFWKIESSLPTTANIFQGELIARPAIDSKVWRAYRLRSCCLCARCRSVRCSASRHVCNRNAQVPRRFAVFGGYSTRADIVLTPVSFLPISIPNIATLNGWNASLEVKVFHFVGAVADVSGYYGSYGASLGCEAILLCVPINGNNNSGFIVFCSARRFPFRYGGSRHLRALLASLI